MLFSLGHGQRIVMPSDGPAESAIVAEGAVRISAVAPGATEGIAREATRESGLSGQENQSFGYYFPDAPGVPGEDMAGPMKNLADAMIEATGDPADADSSIPPIFTYFGQFIDHDITANTDRDAPKPNPISEMTGPTIPPLDRADVVANIVNLRKGSMRLDSLYGEGPFPTPFTEKVRLAMRDPSDRSKMRLGTLANVGGNIALPVDQMADLPRLKAIVDDPNSGLTLADIEALPEGDFKKGFINGGVLSGARAMIGDGRNDENLLVAQLHLAFLRFHNAIAESLKTDIPDADARFDEAKRRTILIYQWLVANVYLPTVCMPSVVDAVKSTGAPLYANFRQRVAPTGIELPLPLEFSAAAYRFGHSMVRASYDHNKNFGRPAENGTRRASFRELFSFTGGDNLGQAAIGIAFTELPSNWPIDWSRFAKDTPDHPDHRARKIDTKLAPPLADMFKESDDAGELGRILRHLAERNLRRGHRLNLPMAQTIVAAINEFDNATEGAPEAAVHQVAYKAPYDSNPDVPSPDEQKGISVLPESVLSEGATGAALSGGGMLDKTPLWYYVLREAEVTEGDTLGPLGSRIIAETMIGLIVQDPESYWAEGAGNGSWTPASLPVAGTPITDMPKMLAAGGLL